VKDGIDSASKDYDVVSTILGPNSETQVDDQIRIIESVIKSRPDAIVLAASDVDRLVPVAQEIRAARIPLVTIDSFIRGDLADTKIGTDNVSAGEKAGEAILSHVGLGSRIAIMSYVQGSSTAIDREAGVRRVLEGKVKVERTYYSSGESEIAYKQTRELLQSDVDLKGIVALNDPTTIGAAQALRDSGRAGDVALVGFDNSLTVLAFVESGVIRDTIVQRPFNMGYLGIKVALDLIKGRRANPFIDTGSQVINFGNMLLPENQKLIFPVSR
ncbi:MAG TPA: substrate-binding domain-containing protein, partial [Spirochaetia bacterium]|nr:substrate-binding domain-containing protein [Spirochaetia bacterium]